MDASKSELRPDDMPIFCYKCRSRYSFKVNPDYPLKDVKTEWVCKVCGDKKWREIDKSGKGG